MPIHCDNFNPDYPGCRECPGMVAVTQPDGSQDRICRAGEKFKREALQVLDRPASGGPHTTPHAA